MIFKNQKIKITKSKNFSLLKPSLKLEYWFFLFFFACVCVCFFLLVYDRTKFRLDTHIVSVCPMPCPYSHFLGLPCPISVFLSVLVAVSVLLSWLLSFWHCCQFFRLPLRQPWANPSWRRAGKFWIWKINCLCLFICLLVWCGVLFIGYCIFSNSITGGSSRNILEGIHLTTELPWIKLYVPKLFMLISIVCFLQITNKLQLME